MVKQFIARYLAYSSFLILGATSAVASDKLNNNETYKLLNLFGDVFEHVRSNYVRQVSDKDLIEAAINGMLISLDPHSSYLNPEHFKNMQVQTQGRFGGLGIEVTMDDGYIRVVSPIDGTPASKAGIKTGDLITHLDGKPILGLSLSQAVKLMRGKVGTSIRLTIIRKNGKTLKLKLVRATIPITTVRSRVEEDLGYIRISSFSQTTETGLKKAMKKLTKELGKNFSGLIIDLRNNPGGLLNQAIAVSDAFLNRGEIVSTRTREKNDHKRFHAKKGDLANGRPIVLLINGGSASASEIVAGALQDHKRAIVLGTKSFGKGSVQTIIPLEKNGAMRLTTALYYTPSGKSIQKVGIQPDIVVKETLLARPINNLTTREEDLRGAINNKGNKSKLKNSSKKQSSASSQKDFQLQRAMDLLKGVAILNKG